MTFVISFPDKYFFLKFYENFVSGAWNENRHTKADVKCEGWEHQEAVGNASDQRRRKRGGGKSPSTNADGGSKTGQGKKLMKIL